MQRSLASRWWYEFVRRTAWTLSLVCLRVRCHHRERVPKSGGFLLLANHQSFLDPPLMGMAVPRRMCFLARETLFTNRLFGAFLRSVDSIPLDRDGLGIGGLKETLRRLKRGDPVLIYPEGTRTDDGEMRPMKSAFRTLVERTNVPVVPLGIDGAYDAFPRGAKFPRAAVVHMVIGEVIPAEAASRLNDEAFLHLVEDRIRACRDEARRRRARAESV